MITLLKLYLMFFKLGIFSFGGGYVVLPLIYQQIEQSNIIPMSEFPDILALSQMTPGPIAINAATYIGFRSSGFLGAAVATLGMVTPSVLMVLLLVTMINKCKEHPLIKYILEGVKPVTVGMIFTAVVYFLEITIINGKLLSSDIFSKGIDFLNIIPLILFLTVLILAVKTRINPIFLTVGAGLVGMLLF